jgi:hypothetical protein
MDKNAGGNNIYSYTITGLDNMGHESSLSGAAGFFSNPPLDKQPKGTERQGKVLKFYRTSSLSRPRRFLNS